LVACAARRAAYTCGHVPLYSVALCASLTASTAVPAPPAGCLTVRSDAVRVIDGDTVAIEGLQLVASGQRLDLGEMTLRLEEISAPEVGWRAACAREARIGN